MPFTQPTPFTLLALISAVLLTSCSRDHDCDSPRSDAIVQRELYSLLSNEFADAQGIARPRADVEGASRILTSEFLLAYDPMASIRRDVAWLIPHLTPAMPQDWGVGRLPLHLSRDDDRILRQAVVLRMTDRQKLPDRTEGTTVHKNVCRARLDFETVGAPSHKANSLIITYSIVPPRKGKRSTRDPFVVVHAATAETAPQFSEFEKQLLHASGLADVPQKPLMVVRARALHAMRDHYER